MAKRHLTPLEIVKRNIVFLIAVFLSGAGVAAVTAAGIGTTPISSPNYVLSLHTPLTLGAITFIFNTLLTVLQVFLVGWAYTKSHWLIMLLQFPTSVVFCAAIDLVLFALHLLLPDSPIYALRIVLLAAGSMLLALGVAMQVCADVAMVPGEAFVKALSQRLKKEFGLVKTCFDVSLVLIAVVFSLIFTRFGAIEGVREGTLIGALSIGPMVRLLLPRLQPRFNTFFTNGKTAMPVSGAEAADTVQAQAAQSTPIITITREYGCGGCLIGRRLAENLGLKFYDNELIGLIAKEAGMDPALVEQREGRLDNSLLYQMVMQDFSVPLYRSLSSSDALFVASSRVIRRAAAAGPCVIVGRGADQILKDHLHCLRVYLYADLEHKTAFCKEHYGEDAQTAAAQMKRNDGSRAEYYRQYFGADIKDPRHYQICLNVGALGLERCCAIITEAFKALSTAAEAA